MRASSNTAATHARTWGTGKPAVAMTVAVALMFVSLKLTAIIKSAAKSVVMFLSFSLRISKLCGFAGRAAFWMAVIACFQTYVERDRPGSTRPRAFFCWVEG